MFYHFNQNNSGGSFVLDEKRGITHHVIIEAKNADQANARAMDIGLYFNGCDDGSDCPCCGDRWYEQYDNKDGTKKPTIYDKDPAEFVDPANKNMLWMKPGKEACVHYADGQMEWF